MPDPHGDVARFRAYMAAFNRHDYGELVDYYDPNVLLVIGNGTELRGRQAIVDFYRNVNDATTRTIEILDAFSDGVMLAAELQSEFLALEDSPDFPTGPLRAGDRMRINTFVLYDLVGGRYSRIRSATFRRELIPGPDRARGT